MQIQKISRFKKYKIIFSFSLLLMFSSCVDYDNITVISSTQILEVTSNTALLEGNLADLNDEITQHGHCWATAPNPIVAGDFKTELGSKTDKGVFQSLLTDLNPTTEYFVRAYAISDGEVFYGREISFTTLQSITSGKELTTQAPYNITASTASIEAELSFSGNVQVTEHGHCWSIEPFPTIEDGVFNQLGSRTRNGLFITNLTDLAPETKYYIRAYVVSNLGTLYSNEEEFITGSN